jgi:hypothetical protein
MEKSCDTARSNFCMWAASVLNREIKLPEHLRELKFVAMSKTSSPDVYLDEIRGICVSSHLMKPLEKAIMAKLKKTKSDLLKVGDY